jgi:hypothetical protein
MHSARDQVLDEPFESLLIQVKVRVKGRDHGRDDAAQRAREFVVQGVS